MKGIPLFTVDVFAEQPLTGNQLAVFISDGRLSDNDMQKLATEMMYSETVFVNSKAVAKNGAFPVRIFTPQREVPFAGHPIIGAAFVIQRQIVKSITPTLQIQLSEQAVDVDIEYRRGRPDTLWLRQPRPWFGCDVPANEILPVVGLNADDIDTSLPIQEVSTGLPFVILPVRTLKAIKRARVNSDRYHELIARLAAKALLLFTNETYEPSHHANVRVFAEYYGTIEDAATGSANGALGMYMLRHAVNGNVNKIVEQGYEIGRPSLVMLKGSRSNDLVVSVGGRVQSVLRGKLVAGLVNNQSK